jgi:hypothetical protein
VIFGLLEENVKGILFYNWQQGNAGSERNAYAGGRILIPDEISLKVSMVSN